MESSARHANLKGTVAKNSFFLGMAKGYCNKIQALKREYNSEVTNALMVIEKKLIDAKAMVYPRLSSTKSSGNYCQQSSALGEQWEDNSISILLSIDPRASLKHKLVIQARAYERFRDFLSFFPRPSSLSFGSFEKTKRTYFAAFSPQPTMGVVAIFASLNSFSVTS